MLKIFITSLQDLSIMLLPPGDDLSDARYADRFDCGESSASWIGKQSEQGRRLQLLVNEIEMMQVHFELCEQELYQKSKKWSSCRLHLQKMIEKIHIVQARKYFS